jgi:ubiquinone biosynthesis protein UbiJ
MPETPTEDETRWAKLQRLSRDVGERLRRGAARGRLRIRVSRLESRIESEKTKIGRALYPLVEEARITVELPEVQEGVETIARLRQEIRSSYARIEEIEKDGGE